MVRRALALGLVSMAACTSGLGELSHGQSAASGAGGASSSSASTGGGGSGGDASKAEICDDGVDNDGDDAIDCQDTDCDGFECTVAPPDGWSGPARLYTGTDEPPACPEGAAPIADGGYGDLTAPPAICGCTCGPPMGGACIGGTIYLYGGPTCGGMAIAAFGNGCVGVGGTVQSALIAAGSALPAPCAPSGNIEMPPPLWETFGRVYALPSGGGCAAATALCVAKSAPPFGSGTCIVHGDDIACPPGPFAVKTLLFGIDDQRSCSACSCEPSVGGTCSDDATLFSDGACTTLVASVPADSTCHELPPVMVGSLAPPSVPSGGACAPLESLPTGSATPAAPVTVCCTPS